MAFASMTTQSPDTDPESERLQIRILRAMTVSQRIAQIEALNALAETFAMVGLRRRHPAATPTHLRRLLRDSRLQMSDEADVPADAPINPDGSP
jgi:propanediol dehydratase large subunit